MKDMNSENDIKKVLSTFDINAPVTVKRIHENAWVVDDLYILKENRNLQQLEKSIMLNHLLLTEEINVAEYIETKDKELYVHCGDRTFCLMKKIKGRCFDPYDGDLKHNGVMLGKAVAKLHIALKRIEDKVVLYESDFLNDFSAWIKPELVKNNVTLKTGILDDVFGFLRGEYKTLPRQLIHRDMHTSNLLYDNGVFSYIDFDMARKNARIFDIVYLGCSQLVDHYMDKDKVHKWKKIYFGILQGYHELLPLGKEEISAMSMLFLFDEILFTAFYLKSGQPESAKNCCDMTNWLYENIGAIIGQWK